MLRPNELLMLVRAAQFEVSMRRTLMHMHDTSVATRKQLAARIEELQTWLRANNFDDMN